MRSHNKMADHLANVAMDTQRALEVTVVADPNYQLHRSVVSAIIRWLEPDLQQWMTATYKQVPGSPQTLIQASSVSNLV